jgi:enamine deaminase RidA (YjgF/YER057c/UK114 family)
MKGFFCITAFCMALLIAGPASLSQAQESAGYSFIRGPMGPQVCVGRYTPPSAENVSGVCEGQLLDLVQFNAISTKLSADRLDQAIQVLEAIDNKLAQSNDRMERLVEVIVSAQSSADRQDRELNELRDTIEKRFEDVPEELLASDSLEKELARLKEDILKEVERRYQPRQTPAVKTPAAK